MQKHPIDSQSSLCITCHETVTHWWHSMCIKQPIKLCCYISKAFGSPLFASQLCLCMGFHTITSIIKCNYLQAQDVNFAMEASRKSRIAFAAANTSLGEAQCRDGISSIKTALDFNFQDVEGLLRLVRLAIEAISRWNVQLFVEIISTLGEILFGWCIVGIELFSKGKRVAWISLLQYYILLLRDQLSATYQLHALCTCV